VADLLNARASFDKRVAESEQIVSSVEALWQTAPLRSDVRRSITEAQLNALYEMAYLTVFGHWENFVEECLVRMLAGQGAPSYSPALVSPPKATTLADSRARILGPKRYMLWYDPVKSADIVAAHVAGSPLESVLRTADASIYRMAAVRHAIAHKSEDALLSFRAAAVTMTGVSHDKPGVLLRSQDHSDPLNPVRWLRRLTTELLQLADASTS
jgi:hypothetical protein